MMESGKWVELPVVCAFCRRVYRRAKIMPISPAPKHIAGTCQDCKSLGTANDGGGGERRNTLAARHKMRAAADRLSASDRQKRSKRN